MHVLVADKFEESGLNGLSALGVELSYQPNLAGPSLLEALSAQPVDVLVVRGTKVSAEMIAAAQLGLIVRAGAGYNTIDIEACSAKGVYVSNCPGKNAHAVAELAFGLMLACDRHIPDNVSDLRAGKWNKKAHSQAQGLYGRTLGVIGLGNISQSVIHRAKAFGMNVVVNSRWLTPETAAALGIGRAATLLELAAMSDFISVHSALTAESRGMINKEFFDTMRPGSVFVNTSRGEIVDEPALIEAVRSKKIVAGLDVIANEPTAAEAVYCGELQNLSGVYVTHHIGASTAEAQNAVAMETVRIISEYKHSGQVPNVVNIQRGEVATHLLVVRHVDKVGVLSYVLGILKAEGASVQEMENIVLSGAKAAIAHIALDKAPSEKSIKNIKMSPDVFDVGIFPISK